VYRISHSYLTFDDEGKPIVETETADAEGHESAAATVDQMLYHPGGRSGTTVALTVTPTRSVAL
jgi:hypothetical protein